MELPSMWFLFKTSPIMKSIMKVVSILLRRCLILLRITLERLLAEPRLLLPSLFILITTTPTPFLMILLQLTILILLVSIPMAVVARPILWHRRREKNYG